MLRLFDNARYDFLGARRVAYAMTAFVAVTGLVVLAVRGLNESIEFTGGAMVQIHVNDSAISISRIRSTLDQRGITGAYLSTYGSEQDFLIRAPLFANAATAANPSQDVADSVAAALNGALGPGTYAVLGSEAIGPKVGGELRTKALLAILLSFGATLVYLTIRFEWRFAIAAILATAHDIILTVSFVSLMHLEISLVVVAAVLTIVGYSLNDTIIVFDRVRENLRHYKRQDIYQILNQSVNETLPRTILTAGTTLVATLSLLIFAGPVIRAFAWVMTFGIITGTFSSIYIASPVLMAVERRWPGEDVRGAKAITAPAVAQTAP